MRTIGSFQHSDISNKCTRNYATMILTSNSIEKEKAHMKALKDHNINFQESVQRYNFIDEN